MSEAKQHTRNEIKEQSRNRLQERYNNLLKDYIELQNKYEKISHFAIETIFSEFNDDVELLSRCLWKQGLIGRTETHYYKLKEYKINE